MKAIIQRVREASVTVEGNVTGSIEMGLLVYLGVAADDSEKDAEWMAYKVANLRIFKDAGGRMNLSLKDIAADADANADAGEGLVGVLTISQFTLLADARKGHRPYYGDAGDPEKAKTLYEFFKVKITEQGLKSEAGVFQAHMDVRYINDGPVTIILDSKS